LAGDVVVSALAKWDGTAFSDVAGGLNNGGLALASDATALYVAGWFTDVGTNFSTVSRHIAQLRGAGSGVQQEIPGQFKLSIADDPTSTSLRIKLDVERAQSVSLIVSDLVGRKCARIVSKLYGVGSHEFSLDAHAWPAGTYAVHASTADGRTLTRMVSIVK
jgi:hypothetical protein